MNFQQLEAQANELRRRLAAGQLTPEQFNTMIANLRLQDARGVWWQADPNSNGWLRWDGAAWVSDTPPPAPAPVPAAPVAPVQPVAATPAVQPVSGGRKTPQTLLQFFGYYIQSAFRHLPKILVAALIQGGIVWLLHSIIMIFVNQGFSRGGNPLVESFLSFPAELFIPGALFWAVMGILYNEIKNKTLGKKIKALFHLPGYVRSSTAEAGDQKAGLVVWLGACIAIVLMTLLNNTLLALSLAIFVMGALIDPQDIVRFILRLGWSDFQKLFKRTPHRGLAPAWLNTTLAGLAVGFVLSAVVLLIQGLGFQFMFLRWLVMLVVVGVTVFLWLRGRGKPAAGMAALFPAWGWVPHWLPRRCSPMTADGRRRAAH